MSRPGILLVGNYPPPYGGVPKHIEDLAQGLTHRGWAVHVLSGGIGSTDHRENLTVYRDDRGWLARRVQTLAFTSRVLSSGTLPKFHRFLPLRRFLTYMGRAALGAAIMDRHRIDVVSGYNLIAGAPVATILARMFRKPLVISNFGEIYSARDRVERELGMIRYMTETAELVTCMTDHCARSYQLLQLSPAVRVIRYGIDLAHFAPDPTDISVLEECGFTASDQVVLFVGRMNADMGMDCVMSAIPAVLERCPNTRFLLAGGTSDLTEAGQAVAARYPHHVRIMVDVPGQRLPSLYRAATLVVVPTRGARACGSLAAAEAMATAKPVVASDVGGVPEYVIAGQTGLLVPPGDPEALARAVISLLTAPDQMMRMSATAYQHVHRSYNADGTNQQLHQAFQQLLRV